MPCCLPPLCVIGSAGVQEFLLPPDSRTSEKFEAELRALEKLPELRKRYAAETEVFSNSEHPLQKKATQMGFSKSSGHVGQ